MDNTQPCNGPISLLAQYELLRSLTPAQKLIYLALSDQGPLSHGELVEATGCSKGGVSGALSDLHEKNLVTPRRDSRHIQHPLWEANDPNSVVS